VQGAVNLLGGELSISLLDGFAGEVQYGDSFSILRNDFTNDDVNGEFFGLANGEWIGASNASQWFQINYFGGDGNDITLTAVPEPTTLTLLLLAAPFAWSLMRRRRRRMAAVV
jgi:hypothetical protein